MPMPPRDDAPADALSGRGVGAPTVVRIRGPQDLPAAVPYLLGFHPESSLVVVATRMPGQVCVTMRVDLPPDDLDEKELPAYAAPMIRALRHAGAEDLCVLVYPGVPGAAGVYRLVLPRQALVDGVRDLIVKAGFEVLEALCVIPEGEGHDRFWSYLCAGTGCCPPEGRMVEPTAATRIGFGFVSHGRGALPNRAAVVASLGPVQDRRSAALLAAARRLERSAERLLGREEDDPGVEQARCRWRAWLARRADRVLACGAATVPRDELAVGEQALLLGALSQASVRDLVVGEAARRDELDAVVGLLTPVVRRAPTGLVAPVAATVALCAYLLGDGALSWIALDRARDDDPSCSLAAVLAGCLDAGVGPGGMWEVVRSLPPVSTWDGDPVLAAPGQCS